MLILTISLVPKAYIFRKKRTWQVCDESKGSESAAKSSGVYKKKNLGREREDDV